MHVSGADAGAVAGTGTGTGTEMELQGQADAFRVSVSLARYFSDERALCFMQAERRRRASWLARRLRRTFALPARPALLCRGHLLPPGEPLAMLRPDDTLEAIPATARVVDVSHTRMRAVRGRGDATAPSEEDSNDDRPVRAKRTRTEPADPSPPSPPPPSPPPPPPADSLADTLREMKQHALDLLEEREYAELKVPRRRRRVRRRRVPPPPVSPFSPALYPTPERDAPAEVEEEGQEQNGFTEMMIESVVAEPEVIRNEPERQREPRRVMALPPPAPPSAPALAPAPESAPTSTHALDQIE